MFRFLVTFCLLSLIFCSVGCRMCCSPYDYCIPAFIDREDDFRGCGPLYRAGSILTGEGCNTCRTTIGDTLYVGNSGEFYSNAGNYGMTTQISVVSPAIRRGSDSLEPQLQESQPRQNTSPIGKPGGLENDNLIPGPYKESNDTESNGNFPTVEELLRSPRRGTTPNPKTPVPVVPPAKPRVNVTPFEESPVEVLPFSPSDEPISPGLFPPTTDSDPPITLEELRRLDPSVRDIQIISIEDAATGTSIY